MYQRQTVIKNGKPETIFGISQLGKELGYPMRVLPRDKMVTSMRMNRQGAVLGVDEAGKAPTLRLVEVLGKFIGV